MVNPLIITVREWVGERVIPLYVYERVGEVNRVRLVVNTSVDMFMCATGWRTMGKRVHRGWIGVISRNVRVNKGLDKITTIISHVWYNSHHYVCMGPT